ncbi:MAG: PDZ domain-containing protein [Planctomycetes bacterium]|nr:PDZ domain-containing protein [Planctomycetota bacterium]
MVALATILVAPCAVAGDFAGLTPGRSTAADARRVLGQPVEEGAILRFPGERYGATEILVEVERDVIRSITLRLSEPPRLEDARKWFALGEPALRETEGAEELLSYLPQALRLRVKEGRVREIVHVALRSEIESRLQRRDFSGAAQLARAGARDAETAFAVAEALHETGANAEALELVRMGRSLAPQDEAGELLEIFVAYSLEADMPGWLGVHLHEGRVAKVFEDTPAHQAGIREGDEIIGLNGQPTAQAGDRRARFAELRVGRQARVHFQRAGTIHLTPIDPEAYFATRKEPEEVIEKAMVLMVRGQCAQAWKLLRQTPAEKRSERFQYELAQAAQVVDLEEGLKEWKRFLANVGAHTSQDWWGHARQEAWASERGLDDYQEAKRKDKADDFRGAAALYAKVPAESSNLFFRLGYCLKRTGEYGRAARAFQAAHEDWLAERVTWYHLAECTEHFDMARSRAACVQFLRLTEGMEDMKKMREATRERKGRMERALLRKMLGDRFAAKGLWTQALADYEAALAIAPKSADLIMAVIRTEAKLGRKDAARARCASLLALGETPIWAEVFALLGDLAYEEKDYQEAAKRFQQAHEAAPDNVVYLYHRAWAVEQLDPKEALYEWDNYLVASQGIDAEELRRQEAREHVDRLRR